MSTVLLVGASRGLGRGLVEEHRRRGWEVVATVRDPRAQAVDGVRTERLDVTDPVGIDALADRLPTLDRLAVAAGVLGPDQPLGEVDHSEFLAALATNTLGPLQVVDRLTARVTARGTVAVLSSQQGSTTLNDTGGHETYRVTKAALDMGLRCVAARRADRRTWLALNPGYVRTDLTGPDAPLSVEESVRAVVDVLDSRAGSGGTAFVDLDGSQLPW